MTFAQNVKIIRFQATMSTLLLSALLMLTGCGEQAPTAKPNAALPAMLAKEPTLEEKVAKWKKEAEAGNAEAQYQLGCVSYFGEGLSKETAMAINWAQHEPKDSAMALEWWQKSAAQGHAGAQSGLGAMSYLGKGVPKDVSKAIELFTNAAEGGNPSAQALLGQWFWVGQGVPRNIDKAVSWSQKAANQGSSFGQDILAGFYERGEGVLKNAEKAVELYQKASIAGNAGAQHSLAMMYANGEGIIKDPVLAYAWSNLAAASSNIPVFRDIAVSTRNRNEAHLSQEQITEGQRIAAGWKKGELLKREAGGEAGAGGPAGISIKRGVGTGFVFSRDGHALTNHHVIDGCKEVKITGREGTAKVITSDITNDIALLQLPGETKDAASITADTTKLRQGEDIVVFGYPLSSALSSGGNLTPGTVSALSGLGNNSNQIQITAPIQPGSSGSPVLDKKGNVVGMVSMKLTDAKTARATGSLPQNVNFAISGQTVKAFLDQNKVLYSTSGGFFSQEKNNADIAEAARKFTVIVECWK